MQLNYAVTSLQKVGVLKRTLPLCSKTWLCLLALAALDKLFLCFVGLLGRAGKERMTTGSYPNLVCSQGKKFLPYLSFCKISFVESIDSDSPSLHTPGQFWSKQRAHSPDIYPCALPGNPGHFLAISCDLLYTLCFLIKHQDLIKRMCVP